MINYIVQVLLFQTVFLAVYDSDIKKRNLFSMEQSLFNHYFCSGLCDPIDPVYRCL